MKIKGNFEKDRKFYVEKTPLGKKILFYWNISMTCYERQIWLRKLDRVCKIFTENLFVYFNY